MKLIACSVLLLVFLEESYCKTTSSVNRTSTSWGYGYSLSDTRGFKVKHDDKGYQFDPFYENTSSGLKRLYKSRSVYDQFTSPGETNDSQSHSSKNDVNDGTSNGSTNSRSKSTGEWFQEGDNIDTLAGEETTTVPVTKTHTVTVTDTQTEAPIATDKTSYETPSSSHSIPVRDMTGFPSIPLNGQIYKTTFRAPYGSQNTPMYAAPTGPLYYRQAPFYGQMYGPAGGSMYDVSNGQIFGPPVGWMYGPPTGEMNSPTGPIYELPTRSMYEYAAQNGQMYGLPNGQTNGYPTGYRSNRYY